MHIVIANEGRRNEMREVQTLASQPTHAVEGGGIETMDLQRNNEPNVLPTTI